MRLNLMKNSALTLLALALLVSAGCKTATPRGDAELTRDVQGKLTADKGLQGRQLTVQAAGGVVTLSGTVASDGERNQASADAAGIQGVRTVVNNLVVQPDLAASAAPAALPDNSQSPAETPAAPVGSVATTTRPGKPSASKANVQPAPAAQSQAMTQADAMAQQRAAEAAPAAPAPQPAPAPVAPPAPQKITVPDGEALAVRLLDTIDSESAGVGDTFRASLNAPVRVNGAIVIPADADLTGRVVEVQPAGRFKGAGLLTVEITRISYNGQSYPVHTSPWSKQIQGRGRNTAEKVGGGAALGALIGAIAGGGKGAGIGAAVGAAGGGVAQGATHASGIRLGPESLLTFHLSQPIAVQPAASNSRNANRPRLE